MKNKVTLRKVIFGASIATIFARLVAVAQGRCPEDHVSERRTGHPAYNSFSLQLLTIAGTDPETSALVYAPYQTNGLAERRFWLYR